VTKLSITSAAAVFAAAAVVTSAAFAGTAAKTVAFKATFTGTATTQANDNLVAINATGAGKGTVIGAAKITGTGTGDSSQQPCVPFTGTGKMTGPGGTVIFKVNPAAKGCGDEAGQVFSVSGKAAVVKATGKLAKAKGTLRMSGTYDRSNGAFSVKFFGTLTK
jgi:hypothetical protein